MLDWTEGSSYHFAVMESPFIILNGSQHQIMEGQSVLTLLTSLEMEKRPVVVELNGIALLPSQFASSPLANGDKIEIVSIVAGG